MENITIQFNATIFNTKDLVSFGNYLFSDERRLLYKNHPDFPNEELLEERLSQASHTDIQNWLWSELGEGKAHLLIKRY